MLNLYASDFEYDLDTVENVSLENRGAGKFYIGWIQTLFRERVKSQSLGNLTLNSESASKIMPACDI